MGDPLGSACICISSNVITWEFPGVIDHMILYCVTFSDATETGPILMPVLVALVCRLDSIISPEFTSWVGIVPVNRKSSGFMQLVGGLYTHLFPLETS